MIEDATTKPGAAEGAFRIDRWLPYRFFLIASRTAELLSGFYVPRYGLTQVSWRILAVVGARPGMSSKEICRAAAIDPFAASRGIAHLVSQGFASRESGTNDRRYASVTLTPEGRAALDEIVALGEAMEAEIEADLTEAERALLRRMLDRMDAASLGAVARGWEAIVPGRATSD